MSKKYAVSSWKKKLRNSWGNQKSERYKEQKHTERVFEMLENNKTAVELEIRDSVSAVVLGNTCKGTYLQLENGMQGFAFFGGLVPGMEVTCSVRKLPSEKFPSALVSIDSVVSWVDDVA